MSQRITKTIFLTAVEAAVYKSTGTCQHVTPDGDTITVSDTDTDCIVYCPEDEPATKAELAEAVKHRYSTTEKVVGTWIDGKPIYEKTIDMNNANIAPNDWREWGNITDLNVDTVVDLDMNLQYEGRYTVISCVDTAILTVTNDKSKFEMWLSRANTCYAITIQYTKTTDTALNA